MCFTISERGEAGLVVFILFIVKLYLRSWFLCQIPSVAPRIDLNFLKEAENFKKINLEIAKAVINKFIRHTWYLGEQLIGLALFDVEVDIDEKRAMVNAFENPSNIQSRIKGQVKESQIETATLSQFVSKTTLDFLYILSDGQDMPFLQMDPSDWHDNVQYKSLCNKVNGMAVVNDHAERAIALIKDFNNIITRKEDQKQFLLQTIEHNRQKFPKFTKKSIIEGLKN